MAGRGATDPPKAPAHGLGVAGVRRGCVGCVAPWLRCAAPSRGLLRAIPSSCCAACQVRCKAACQVRCKAAKGVDVPWCAPCHAAQFVTRPGGTGANVTLAVADDNIAFPDDIKYRFRDQVRGAVRAVRTGGGRYGGGGQCGARCGGRCWEDVK